MALCIVIADDEVDTTQALQYSLEDAGHTVHVAFDGAKAFDLIREHQPDVALLDIAMPGMNGLDVANFVGELGIRTWLVAITGWDEGGARQHTAQAGFHAHLTKPASLVDIRALVDKIERQKAALRE